VTNGERGKREVVMQTIQVRGKTAADGVLHLSIPLGTPDAEFEAVVVVQPQTPAPADNGWPPGFFEDTVGGITDETFVRPPQCQHEKPAGA
jgi:hypothetical protein